MAKLHSEEKWVLMTELNSEPLLHHFKLSNHGNVVRMKKGTGPEEAFHPKTIGGYKYLSLTTRHGSQDTLYLHRLVAEFFIEKKDEEAAYVIHKDYDRLNNRADNLDWVTRTVLLAHRSKKAGRVAGSSREKVRIERSNTEPNEALAFDKFAKKRQLATFLGVKA